MKQRSSGIRSKIEMAKVVAISVVIEVLNAVGVIELVVIAIIIEILTEPSNNSSNGINSSKRRMQR